jgi:hypothetical protein
MLEFGDRDTVRRSSNTAELEGGRFSVVIEQRQRRKDQPSAATRTEPDELFPVQVQNVRRAGTRERDIRLAVTVDIADGEPVCCARLVAERDLRESLA